LLDQVTGPVAALTGDGACDRTGVYAAVQERHPEAAVAVPPRCGYNQRAKVEGQIGRWKQVLEPALRFHTDASQATGADRQTPCVIHPHLA